MRAARDWKEYEIIDTSDGEKLERWGDVLLIRPDPQIIWKGQRASSLWKQAAARYIRSSSGGGSWSGRPQKESWQIGYKGLVFKISPTGFKHTGLFPEQAVNWDYMGEKIARRLRIQPDKPVKVLNLFAYTGGATLACARAGAQVTHVDASKGMVSWARENARLSGLEQRPVRWIVDDCRKFVEREIRRGNRYDALVMDPPSYGRGPSGEVWQLEEQVYPLLELCSGVLTDNPLFFLLNSYTTGLSPAVMEYLLGVTVFRRLGGRGRLSSSEIGLPVTQSGLVLPCGNTAIWEDGMEEAFLL